MNLALYLSRVRASEVLGVIAAPFEASHEFNETICQELYISCRFDRAVPIVLWFILMIPEVDLTSRIPRYSQTNGVTEWIIHDPKQRVRNSPFITLTSPVHGEIVLFAEAPDVMYASVSSLAIRCWSFEPERSSDVTSIA